MANPPCPKSAMSNSELIGRAFLDSRDTGPFGSSVPYAGQPQETPPSPLDRLVNRIGEEIKEWRGPPTLPPLKREYIGYGAAGSSAWAQKVASTPELHQGYRKLDQSDAIGGENGRTVNGFWAPKCNIFVYDALRSSGIEPPTTKEWVDPSKVSGYRVLRPGEPLMQGDVITNGHHVGIFTPQAVGDKIRNLTTSAASPLATADQPLGGPITNDWAFRTATGDLEPGYVVRRYVEPLERRAKR